MTNNDLSRILHYQTLVRQHLDAQLKRLIGTAQTASEPYQRPVSESGTIRAEDFFFYAAESGSREARIALWIARASVPELTKYIPEYSVAKESMQLAEHGRDQSGFVQQTVPQINATNKHGPAEKKPYSTNPYSYTKYSATNLKSAFKKVYTGIEDEVKKLFSKIRSVYQSRLGVLKGRKTYEGQDSKPSGNVISLDSYRVVRQGVQYQQPNDSSASLEKRLAA